MNGCRYEHADRKCYNPKLIDPELGPDWCVEGPCSRSEPDDQEELFHARSTVIGGNK